MSGAEPAVWLGRLEGEIARELGQPVRLSAGGEWPGAAEGAGVALILPEARLRLGVPFEPLAAFFAESRLIEAGQADEPMLREIWMGILASVAARMEGRAEEAEGTFDGDVCTLRLGGAALPLRLQVEAAPPSERPPASAAAPWAARPPRGNYDLLLEVELDALVRFGSREMELKELLELGPGDVVELDRGVQDPVDLVVGDKIVARGEVVLVNGNFGLRVTEVAEPVRRLETIRCMM